MTKHYLHVHDGKGTHADGETYSIVILCDECFETVDHTKIDSGEVEWITKSDEEHCDKCDDACAGCLTASNQYPCRKHGCTSWCRKHYRGLVADGMSDMSHYAFTVEPVPYVKLDKPPIVIKEAK